MTEPWFDPNMYAWLPGTVLGVVGGLIGSLVGVLAPRGIGKQAMYAAFAAMIGISALFLVAAIVALATGQPYGVWYGLGLPGLLCLVLFSSLVPVLRLRYREAELRRLNAANL